ncbi:MAG: peptidase M24 [Chloroflexi bacterium GWB2_49_20]|nr:MAG: peptidase M24 [Chloroflexi bacterium GWB2_49_20]OGN80519.1 MAG: peptidase M24 [Chloroflexi bacterium GWC2_49_37]OGN83354.1 MAG: peptidase M24 [Chloroflexi bacterium GWD2_49_16]HCC78156.1 aminopeptidase P family protein [Anaerolineae bacterium]
MKANRIEKPQLALQNSELDALVLNPGPSLVYTTGMHFHLMERPVVVIFTKNQPPVIVLPELEEQKLVDLPYKIQGFPYGEKPDEWQKAFDDAIRYLDLKDKNIGMEPRSLRLLEYGFLQAATPGAKFMDAGETISSMRLVKDAEEVDAMRRAVGVAQKALQNTLPLIKIGMTEKEVAGELTLQLLRHGSEPEMGFSPIVSGGLNGANPHATPGTRELQVGDLLVIDWGAMVDGYISDLTRTFSIGAVEPEYRKIHQIVQEANSAGRAAGKPGDPCAHVDKAARNVIEKAGYGVYFTHRTGHGIGMEGHEEPYMRGDNMQILQPGMAYTVEPGIYLPGRNGVRIEDDMVITGAGCESLSDMPRELTVIG